MNQLPTYRTSPTQQALQLCVAVLTLLFATGCGGGGGSSAPPASTTPAASSNAQLSGLTLSSGSIAFDPATTRYNLTVSFMVTSLQITPSVANSNATITVAGQSVASGTTVSVSLVEGANNIDVVITAEDGTSMLTYTLTVDRQTSAGFAQDAYVKASNSGEIDRFGTSVALSGDTLAVGAPLERSNAMGIDGDQLNNLASFSGAVYVFKRDSTGTWSQEAYIKASNTEANDDFGRSVALSGDTLAVGALSEASNATGIDGDQLNNLAPFSGAVYVFKRDSTGTWSQEAYIKASNTEANDDFGRSVALSGDTLAVGALSEASNATGIDGDQLNNLAPNSGAVYVFKRDSFDAWSQEAYIKASNTAQFNFFGRSMALSGDMLTVGAPNESSSATGINGDQLNNLAPNSGAVYVFKRDSFDAWSQEAYIKASNTDFGDLFGQSVVLSGDTLAVGAPTERSNATGIDGDQLNNLTPSGAVYVFKRDSTGTWSQEAYIKASNTGFDDFFGVSLALSGDTLAVGADDEDSNATGIDGDQGDNSAGRSGAVYLFKRDGTGTWSQEAYIKASNTAVADEFGVALALSGETLAVGAHLEDSNAIGFDGDQDDNSARDSGAVYVFQ
ncbi:MAG: hypothetical protein ACI87A_000187 [Planctomycetota bacterium]|jgi:hypothetical protein